MVHGMVHSMVHYTVHYTVHHTVHSMVHCMGHYIVHYPCGQVRLVDFGLTASKDLDEANSMRTYGMERRGTLPYLPPEAIGRKEGGLPSDLWALGVVLFMTLGGYHPFDAKGEADLTQTSVSIVLT